MVTFAPPCASPARYAAALPPKRWAITACSARSTSEAETAVSRLSTTRAKSAVAASCRSAVSFWSREIPAAETCRPATVQ